MALTRTVHQTRRPAQLGQPARVQPASTRSDVSGGRTRVPTKLTRSHAGRLSVFGFQTRDTRPELNPLSFRWSITIFRPNPARSRRYLTKSRPDLDGSGQISIRSRRIQPYFGQISKDPVRFRPYLAESDQISSPVINPKPTRINPKPMKPKPKNPTRSPGRFRVNFLFTRHIRVESGLNTNPTRPDPWTPLKGQDLTSR